MVQTWGGENLFKNLEYSLCITLNLRALNFSRVNKINTFLCMGKIFCVEFQRYPLKFHTKYLTHTQKDVILHNILIARALSFKNELVSVFDPRPVSSHAWNRKQWFHDLKDSKKSEKYLAKFTLRWPFIKFVCLSHPLGAYFCIKENMAT